MELNIKFDEEMIVEMANRVLDEYEYKGKTIREWADFISHPKTNAEYIEREAFLDAIERMKPYHQDADDIAEMLQNFPAADVAPIKHAKWIDKSSKKLIFGRVLRDRIVQCDQCRNYLDMDGVNGGRGDANYCPNCGADMREES